jgi:hypothetical protein
MFMSITNMNVGALRFGGLMIMTKAVKRSLPTVGRSSSNSSWYTGVESGENTVISRSGSGSTTKDESVNLANKSYVTSNSGSSTIFTRYIDTPTNGLLFSKSSTSSGVTIGSPTGWSVAMIKGAGTEFDGWMAYIRAKR